MSIVIKVENISKQYRLGAVGTGSLAHDLNRSWHRVRGKEDPYLKIGDVNDRTTKGRSEYVWAIKDINFEVKQGEVLGIIGRNGAGKSTLLKILSRTTTPTTGQIKIKGRVASLLEVGTGFHPELSGRENIFLNGAILGMTRHEIKSKFDEIVDFAGVERYIDTPVKRYSSGMYVRLAFGVAAHLEPEILIVDEVLAVGDAEFQKKALGKMKDVSNKEGRTVLFVSHNMAAVKSLCTQALLLENGQIKISGTTENCISAYLKGGTDTLHKIVFTNKFIGDDYALKEINFTVEGKQNGEPLLQSDAILLNTNIVIKNNADKFHVTYHVVNEMGEAMFAISNALKNTPLQNGDNMLTCIFPANFYNPGTYYLTFFLVKNKASVVLVEKDIISFTVVDANRELGVYMGNEPGYIRPDFKWENQIL